VAALRAQAVLREYTVSRPTHELLADLLQLLGAEPTGPGQPPQVLGLGVYIWNVMATTQLLRLLRQARPDVRVVLGGRKSATKPMDRRSWRWLTM
jgi:hypothetical protein